MHAIETQLISLLVAFAQGTNSSRFPNWQSSWIEGGSDASPREFPYMVLVRNFLPRSVIDCGGSIINYWYTLTSAHCVIGGTTAMIKVTVGTNKFHGAGQIYGVSRIIMHQAFDKSTHNNDISLLRLVTPVVYSATVQPVILPNQDQKTAPGTSCIFAGWGKNSNSATSQPFNLQKLQLNTISNDQCKKYYRYIFDTKICGIAESGKGTRKGDSGGPLICGGKQVGVLRGRRRKGFICATCTASLPIEFIYVPKYIDWIKRHADVTPYGLFSTR